MYKKLVGIVVFGLLIATALPIIGAGNELKNNVDPSSINSTNDLKEKGNVLSEQMLDIEWNKTYGGPEYDMIYYVHETDDGGFIASGEQFFSGIPYGWLLKLDSEGNEEWNISLPGDPSDIDIWIMFAIQTNDGGYIACGFNGTQLTGDGFILKVDSEGVTEWKKPYPFGEGEYGPIHCVQEINDGFVAVGPTQSDTGSGLDSFFIKTDFSGNVELRKTFSLGNGQDLFWSIRATSDDGYIIGGTGVPEGNSDYWLVKIDASGNEQWNETFGGTRNDYSYSRDCLKTDDGGYIMTGCSYSFTGTGPGQVWLVKTDANGQMEWNKTYGIIDEHDVSWSMDTSHGGGYIFVAAKNYNGVAPPGSELWLVKTDNNGNIERSETFGGPNEDRGYYVSKTSDSGYIMSGRTESFGDVNSDGWIIKISSYENEKPEKPEKPSGENKVKLGKDYTYESSTTDSDGHQLYYKWDWGDGNESEWLGPFNSGDTCEASHNWSMEGEYSIKVKAKDIFDFESDWSDPLDIKTPRGRDACNTFLIWFFKEFPNAFPLLKQLLDL